MGGIDILVNNAGIGAAGTVADNPDDQWHHVFDVNVVGIVRVTRAALPYLRASAHAAIVNTCSIAATAGLPQRALYSATKGAVLALTLAMAADHVHEGIRVNCVNPGTADTPWVGRLLDAADDPAAERAALEARQPMGRLVSADEVAAGIAYLASPLAGVGHRHGARDRRRHGRPAPAAAIVTGGQPRPGSARGRRRPAQARPLAGLRSPSCPSAARRSATCSPRSASRTRGPRWTRPGRAASAPSTPRRTTASGCPSAASATRCGTARATST